MAALFYLTTSGLFYILPEVRVHYSCPEILGQEYFLLNLQNKNALWGLTIIMVNTMMTFIRTHDVHICTLVVRQGDRVSITVIDWYRSPHVGVHWTSGGIIMLAAHLENINISKILYDSLKS